MILFIYASLIFLVLRFSVTLFNFLSNPKLGHYGKHFKDRVSIVFFDKEIDNEVGNSVNSLKLQDYINIEILIKGRDEKLSDIVASAEGRYLLFLRGDVVLSRDFINNLIYRVKLYDLAMISIIPDRKFKSLVSYCFYPLKDFLLMSVFPMRLARLMNIPAFFIASQSCMFFDAEKYRRGMNGKTKMELLQANKFVVLHENMRFLDLGKEVMKIFGNNFFVALIYLVLVIAGPVVMFLNVQLVFLVLPFGLMFLMRMMVSFLSGQKPVLNVLLHPIQMLLLVVVLIYEAVLRGIGWSKS